MTAEKYVDVWHSIEPHCIDGDEHNWQAPGKLGLAENPGESVCGWCGTARRNSFVYVEGKYADNIPLYICRG